MCLGLILLLNNEIKPDNSELMSRRLFKFMDRHIYMVKEALNDRQVLV
jgi:hypothetical protein